jgi:hypothetical protein
MAGCSIDGCSKPHKSRGWCMSHYSRWLRHGSPVGGSTSTGAAIRYLDEVVMAYDGDECIAWPFSLNPSGYGRVKVPGSNKITGAHRLICEKVNGPPPSPEHLAAHSCGKGHEGCVTKRHLSWKTPSENQLDRIVHGTDGRGEKNPRARLTADAVRQIRALSGVISHEKLGRQYGVSRPTIGLIMNRTNWGWLE